MALLVQNLTQQHYKIVSCPETNSIKRKQSF